MKDSPVDPAAGGLGTAGGGLAPGGGGAGLAGAGRAGTTGPRPSETRVICCFRV